MIPTMNSVVEKIPEARSIYINQIVTDKKSRGERVYTYSLGEAFFDIPRLPLSAELFQKGYHYSDSMGQPALRKKIAEMYGRQYGVSVNWENEVLISAGSKVIIYMLLKAVLAPGEEVLVREPAWLSYQEQVRLAGGVHVPVPYDRTVFQLEDYITPRTKVIIINNPNNPSGQLYMEAELAHLLHLAQKYGLFILSDEAYSDFLLEGSRFLSFAKMDETKEHCLVVNSLSKNMGMSGWRVGYAIAHPQVIYQLLKLNQHMITCAATVLQNYMAEHFDEILAITLPQARAMAEKRKKVQAILSELGMQALDGVGTFYFMLDVSSFPGTTEELVYALLLVHNIATVPGEAYGESTRDFVRFGIGVESLADIRVSLETIKGYLTLSDYDGTAIRQKIKKLKGGQ